MQWELTNRPRKQPVRFLPSDPGYGPEYCVQCDADMPTARRVHGFDICVECKTKEEEKQRLHRY